MELWDAYDSSINLIEGKVLVRGEPLPEGIFHLVCDILVRHEDGTYLLMKRDPKKHYGGMWEATAGGSALSGEVPMECAIRELKEETGIACENMVELGTEISFVTQTIYVGFLCVTDWDKNSVVLQDGETVDYMWVSKQELLSMKKDELVTVRMQKYIV